MITPKQFSSHLICPADSPILSDGRLRQELTLYNVSADSMPSLLAEFTDLTGKSLTPDSPVSILSGGQKVLLMCLLALHSPARYILFIDLWHNLDACNRDRIKALLQSYGNDRQIAFQDTPHVDPRG